MPIARFQMPDGRIARFDVPEGTSPEQAQSMMEQHFAPQQNKPQEPQLPAVPAGGIPSFGEGMQTIGNLAAGAVRGAGSIGSTIMAPYDIAKDAISGRGMSLQSNQERRQAMDDALQNMGADPNSLMYKGGKLGSEVAGTLGVGGALAKGAEAIPAIANNAPMLINALRSGGTTLGGTTGSKMADMGIRMAGGAATGGASAGLINPEDAKTGAVIGALAPPVIQTAADAGQAIGKKMASKYADALSKFSRNAPLRDTVKEAVDAGYVIPPNMVNPSFKNAMIESMSGKQATAQIASVRNQDTTEKLVRQALGLSDDAPLTKSALEQIRKIQGGAYQRVGQISEQAASDLEALKQARNDAQGWFKAYNRSASPADLAKAKEFRVLTDQLETALETHATDAGKPELIPALHEARKQIAKTYTVERALNDAGGNVNAKVIGRMYDKGAPLSDGLDTVGKFASRFGKVAQPAEQMGSPAAHNLRTIASMLLGGGGYAAAGPVGAAAAAAPLIAPPLARSIMFRPGVQQALANQSAPTMSKAAQLAAMLQNPDMQAAIAKSLPAISAQGR